MIYLYCTQFLWCTSRISNTNSRFLLDPPISTEHCDWLYGIFGHETSCTRYWTCWNGTATEQFCIGGLLYNEETHACDWPQNVGGCQKHRELSYICQGLRNPKTFNGLIIIGDPSKPNPLMQTPNPISICFRTPCMSLQTDVKQWTSQFFFLFVSSSLQRRSQWKCASRQVLQPLLGVPRRIPPPSKMSRHVGLRQRPQTLRLTSYCWLRRARHNPSTRRRKRERRRIWTPWTSRWKPRWCRQLRKSKTLPNGLQCRTPSRTTPTRPTLQLTWRSSDLGQTPSIKISFFHVQIKKVFPSCIFSPAYMPSAYEEYALAKLMIFVYQSNHSSAIACALLSFCTVLHSVIHGMFCAALLILMNKHNHANISNMNQFQFTVVKMLPFINFQCEFHCELHNSV